MKIIKTTLAALLIASLAGCAASPAEQAVKNVTIIQPACCETFSEFAWIPMNGDSIDFAVDEYSQVGNFAEGKSYFTGFVLPENVERMRVELKSWMRSTGVFAPKVLLLSPTFQVVDSYELSDFEVKPSDMLRLSSYRKSFDMNQATTPYLVVYSPLAYREGSIQIPHPERVRAEELGLARPMVTDPTIQHQKFGSLELDFKPLALRSYRSHTTVSQKVAPQPVETAASVEAVSTVPAASVVLSNAAVQQPSAVNSPAMLPETEAFYNNQIQLAVEKNDIQRALKLMEEAKRAGSATAESTFIGLIKK